MQLINFQKLTYVYDDIIFSRWDIDTVLYKMADLFQRVEI